MDVAAASGASAAGGSQSNALGKLTSDFDSFLTLLTQQLQNQDPLSPMEATEFTTQLVQFASVEQAIQTNTTLDQLLAAESSNQVLSALNFIGREIEAIGNSSPLIDGYAQFSYSLPQDATSTSFNIRDANGAIVFTGTGPTTAGSHQIVWDGVGTNGQTYPEGTYSFEVAAADDVGNPIQASTGMVGTVSGVETRDGQPVVMVGDVPVPLTNITAVRQPTIDNDGQPAA